MHNTLRVTIPLALGIYSEQHEIYLNSPLQNGVKKRTNSPSKPALRLYSILQNKVSHYYEAVGSHQGIENTSGARAEKRIRSGTKFLSKSV